MNEKWHQMNLRQKQTHFPKEKKGKAELAEILYRSTHDIGVFDVPKSMSIYQSLIRRQQNYWRKGPVCSRTSYPVGGIIDACGTFLVTEDYHKAKLFTDLPRFTDEDRFLYRDQWSISCVSNRSKFKLSCADKNRNTSDPK